MQLHHVLEPHGECVKVPSPYQTPQCMGLNVGHIYVNLTTDVFQILKSIFFQIFFLHYCVGQTLKETTHEFLSTLEYSDVLFAIKSDTAQDRSPFCIFHIMNEISQHPELMDTF